LCGAAGAVPVTAAVRSIGDGYLTGPLEDIPTDFDILGGLLLDA